jgi:hypothetical protein
VFHGRKWIVEVVQERAPALIFGGLTEPDGMVFQSPPMDQQQISVGSLEAAPQLMRIVTGHRRNDRRSLAERSFEGGFFAGANVEDGNFEDHRGIEFRKRRRLGGRRASVDVKRDYRLWTEARRGLFFRRRRD